MQYIIKQMILSDSNEEVHFLLSHSGQELYVNISSHLHDLEDYRISASLRLHDEDFIFNFETKTWYRSQFTYDGSYKFEHDANNLDVFKRWWIPQCWEVVLEVHKLMKNVKESKEYISSSSTLLESLTSSNAFARKVAEMRVKYDQKETYY